MVTNSSNLNILMDDFDTRTTPTTGTTRSSAKRVRTSYFEASNPSLKMLFYFILLMQSPYLTCAPFHSSVHPSVWVGPLVVKELKRIVGQSEIIK
jgi:hypothetical protein